MAFRERPEAIKERAVESTLHRGNGALGLFGRFLA